MIQALIRILTVFRHLPSVSLWIKFFLTAGLPFWHMTAQLLMNIECQSVAGPCKYNALSVSKDESIVTINNWEISSEQVLRMREEQYSDLPQSCSSLQSTQSHTKSHFHPGAWHTLAQEPAAVRQDNNIRQRSPHNTRKYRMQKSEHWCLSVCDETDECVKV